jgi:hypothetical protein
MTNGLNGLDRWLGRAGTGAKGFIPVGPSTSSICVSDLASKSRYLADHNEDFGLASLSLRQQYPPSRSFTSPTYDSVPFHDPGPRSPPLQQPHRQIEYHPEAAELQLTRRHGSMPWQSFYDPILFDDSRPSSPYPIPTLVSNSNRDSSSRRKEVEIGDDFVRNLIQKAGLDGIGGGEDVVARPMPSSSRDSSSAALFSPPGQMQSRARLTSGIPADDLTRVHYPASPPVELVRTHYPPSLSRREQSSSIDFRLRSASSPLSRELLIHRHEPLSPVPIVDRFRAHTESQSPLNDSRRDDRTVLERSFNAEEHIVCVKDGITVERRRRVSMFERSRASSSPPHSPDVDHLVGDYTLALYLQNEENVRAARHIQSRTAALQETLAQRTAHEDTYSRPASHADGWDREEIGFRPIPRENDWDSYRSPEEDNRPDATGFRPADAETERRSSVDRVQEWLGRQQRQDSIEELGSRLDKLEQLVRDRRRATGSFTI